MALFRDDGASALGAFEGDVGLEFEGQLVPNHYLTHSFLHLLRSVEVIALMIGIVSPMLFIL